MRLTYVLDYVFRQTPDGRVWTDTSYDATFWKPYLALYDAITIVSRVLPADACEIGWKQVDGTGIRVAAAPHYDGPLHYLLHAAEVGKTLRRIFAGHTAVILRMPSNLARSAARQLDRMGRQYAVDVVGDPYEALAPGVVRMRGRALFRRIFTRAQQQICQRAMGVHYVADCLRQRYPAGPDAQGLVCSDVRLGEEWMAAAPRAGTSTGQVKLLTVATLSQTYKGIDVLLKAVQQGRQRGHALSLTIVGTGRFRTELEAEARQLGLAEHVSFTGSIAWGPRLMTEFDAADVFVLPSRVEVMPRALLEAMARALPAVATRVGAVAEVLDAEDIVPAGDVDALAARLIACARYPETMAAMSARNLARAQQFAPVLLQERWQRYHAELHRRNLSQAPPRGGSLSHSAAA